MSRRPDEPTAAELRALAQRCRAQAGTVSTHGVRVSLQQMAADYDRRADDLERAAA
jgi:hypothetical protein